MRVLIVDEDSAVRREVVDRLERDSFMVWTASTAVIALEQLALATFDIVILSLELPDGAGLQILRTLREIRTPIHVIALSGAVREEDRLEALDLGADDYVLKPFFVRELAARLVAVRRHQIHAKDSLLVYGRLTVDLKAREATLDNATLNLTPLEFTLLAFLTTRPGHAFSRDELLHAVWKSSASWQRESTVTEHVRTLRAKIEPDASQPRLLQTVRGVGYRFDPPSDDPATPTSAPVGVEPSQPLEGMYVAVDGRIVTANEVAATMLGAASETDLIGRRLSEFVAVHTVDAPRDRSAAPGGAPDRRTVAIRQPDGLDTYIELRSSPTEWNDEPTLATTMRLRVDRGAALRHIITGVVSEVSDAVIVTDRQFRIQSWNDSAERLYGWAEHEVLSRHTEEVLRFSESNLAINAARVSLDENGRWFGEISLTARDGSPVTVWCSSATIRDDHGQPVLIAAVHRPVVTRRTPAASAVAADEAAIRQGLARNEFVTRYEPIIALESGRVAGIEGSAAWDHPLLGLVDPSDSIDLGEHVDAILEVERVIFDAACHQAATWRQARLEVELAIHLSNAQLSHSGLFDEIAMALTSSGLDPHALWLEVTETALVEDIQRAVRLLRRFEELGVRVAVDNFGIGWASLTYLKELPVHALKIDEHFVHGVDRHHQDEAITASVLRLGRELGLTVIAVGVETVAQDAALRALGCAFGQGPLYGRPTSPASLSFEGQARS